MGAEAVGGGWREMLRVIGVLLVDERCLREMHRVGCAGWDVQGDDGGDEVDIGAGCVRGEGR